jgi:hypothetical protein
MCTCWRLVAMAGAVLTFQQLLLLGQGRVALPTHLT